MCGGHFCGMACQHQGQPGDNWGTCGHSTALDSYVDTSALAISQLRLPLYSAEGDKEGCGLLGCLSASTEPLSF